MFTACDNSIHQKVEYEAVPSSQTSLALSVGDPLNQVWPKTARGNKSVQKRLWLALEVSGLSGYFINHFNAKSTTKVFDYVNAE